MGSPEVHKLVVFLCASLFFLGLVYLFTSEPPLTITGASVAGVETTESTGSPLIVFVVLGIAIYTLLTIVGKREHQ